MLPGSKRALCLWREATRSIQADGGVIVPKIYIDRSMGAALWVRRCRPNSHRGVSRTTAIGSYEICGNFGIKPFY